MKHFNRQLHSFQQTGFTLIELILVILILGIISINVGSRFFTTSGFAERKVADELVEAIRYAQHVAMSRGGGIRIVTTSTSYTVEQTDGTAITNPNRSGNYSVSIPAGTNLSATTISFNGLGQPNPIAGDSITVGSGSPFTITIEGETGYARY